MTFDMGFPRRYFSNTANEPPPLIATATRRVRFEEVDSLGIVWHGRYPSFLEDGRRAFGDRYGLSYQALKDSGTAAPIVQMHIDYLAPLYFDDTITITATLHWCDALKLNFAYRITRGEHVAAQGYTVQLFTDSKGRTLYIAPAWIQKFRQDWRDGTPA